ncbi:class I SAM-dependent methyltransferase [Inquilinus sp. Marseille-Q2685]|uniref:class I SAM-dependent methyltransferase n=1 Tax=Inquilinus sp. Marseille-Q2685 TaxID=2866581 RepID=UPI001CE3E8AE|nr:methyltransferase domain-containing protein [Inquilinus sp. Marseille-Q2685]
MTPTMMVPRTEPAPSPPRDSRQELLAALRALRPASVLDVGCGVGALLRAVAADGAVRGVGLAPEEAAAERARAAGLDVQPGRAEALPFADGSFDVVTLEYVAHHVEHLPRALREAARVARRAVLVLDGWYDEALPSQRVMRDLDGWRKRIDRRLGMVHNPCPKPYDLIDPLLACGPFEIDYACRLELTPRPLAELEAAARRHLEAIAPAPELAAELDRILDDGRLHGCTDAGTLLLAARWP